ncbi:MAG: EAL domain-containing protein [Thermomicrobium sp.]|nr:EAL domain-containing protein [Thermomicrobium sp.]
MTRRPDRVTVWFGERSADVCQEFRGCRECANSARTPTGDAIQTSERLATLARLATLLNVASDLSAALCEALPLVLEVVGSRTGWISLRRGEAFDLVAAENLPPGLVADDHRMLRWSPCTCQRLADSGGLSTTAEIVACERLARLREQAGDPETAHRLSGGLRYHLSVPLRAPSGRLVGLLNLARSEPDPVDATTRLFLDLIGEFLASAVERAELTEELRRLRSEERERATALAHELVGRERLDDVADAVFSALVPVLQPDALSLLAVDPSGQFLVLRAGRGWSASLVDQLWLPLAPPTHNGPAWALATREPFVIRLDRLDRPFHVPPAVRRAGVRVSAFFPLFAGERPVGVLVTNYRSLHEPSEERLRFAALLAEIGAVAVARALERERNDMLLSELPVGIYRLDPHGTVLWANRAFAQLLGWERREDVAGRSIAEWFAEPADAAHWLGRLARGEAVTGAEYRWRTRDGGVRWVRLTARGYRNPQGALLLVEGTVEDISERKEAEEHLAYLAHHDPLTGLANRHALVRALEEALARAWRSGESGALLLDLDNFKLVNDRLGHGAGDAVLRSVATRLATALRRGEVVARLGGDEFAVVCFPIDRRSVRRVAQRLLAAISEITVSLPDRVISVSASCGIASIPEHGHSVEELLVAADRALYTAKFRGGERIELYEPERHRSDGSLVVRSLATLQAALERNDFLLLAQPIVDLRSRRPVGQELLLRLRKDRDRSSEPENFLPIAERLGLMPKLDLWVIRQALRSAERTGQRVHVNLSAQTLRDTGTLRTLVEEVEKATFLAGNLVLELTETAAIADFQRARDEFTALRSRGCRFAIDDFGVGYSSLYQLRSLPIDILKIDGSFVAGLLDDPVNRHIVRAIVELARALGTETVAEWVEDERLVPVLQELGVDYGQGFALGPPVPLEPS